MDNLTHTLFGATIARTPLGRAGRGTTAALLLASNAPDIDIVATAGGAVKYLEWHRGPTHGPLGIVVLALVTAGLVWIGRRIFDRRMYDQRSAARDGAPTDADNASFLMRDGPAGPHPTGPPRCAILWRAWQSIRSEPRTYPVSLDPNG